MNTVNFCFIKTGSRCDFTRSCNGSQAIFLLTSLHLFSKFLNIPYTNRPNMPRLNLSLQKIANNSEDIQKHIFTSSPNTDIYFVWRKYPARSLWTCKMEPRWAPARSCQQNKGDDSQDEKNNRWSLHPKLRMGNIHDHISRQMLQNLNISSLG